MNMLTALALCRSPGFRYMSSNLASSSVPQEGLAEAILHSNGIGHINLTRPAALNALSLAMVTQIVQQLKQWSSDSNVKAILFTGAGPKAFCAGGDVRQLATEPGLPEAFFRTEYFMNHYIQQFSKTFGKPIVSLIHGVVMGGGVGVSLHGDYRVATDSTMFAMPETTIGFFPDVGGTYVLPRLHSSNLPRAAGSVGMYLGLTGARLRSPSDLLLTGIATHFVSQSRWTALIKELQTASLGPNAKQELGQLLNQFHELPIPQIPNPSSPSTDSKKAAAQPVLPTFSREVLAVLEFCFGSHIESVEQCLLALDDIASDRVHLQIPVIQGNDSTPLSSSSSSSSSPSSSSPRVLQYKREALSDAEAAHVKSFAAKTAKELRGKSPIALKITFRALRENAKKTLAQSLSTEFRLGLRMTAASDFKEGVRALLIDKDNKPVWNPTTIEEASSAQVDEYFAPLKQGQEPREFDAEEWPLLSPRSSKL